MCTSLQGHHPVPPRFHRFFADSGAYLAAPIPNRGQAGRRPPASNRPKEASDDTRVTLELPLAATDDPLDVFDHPYAYAAARGLSIDPVAASP